LLVEERHHDAAKEELRPARRQDPELAQAFGDLTVFAALVPRQGLAQPAVRQADAKCLVRRGFLDPAAPEVLRAARIFVEGATVEVSHTRKQLERSRRGRRHWRSQRRGSFFSRLLRRPPCRRRRRAAKLDHRFAETKLVVHLDESDRIAALATPEALPQPAFGSDRQRRRLAIGMKRAPPLPGLPLAPQIDPARLDQPDQIGAVLHAGYFGRGDHQGLALGCEGVEIRIWIMCNRHGPHRCTPPRCGGVVTPRTTFSLSHRWQCAARTSSTGSVSLIVTSAPAGESTGALAPSV
jgi:hypothetical protein